jgi:hypothetical protein
MTSSRSAFSMSYTVGFGALFAPMDLQSRADAARAKPFSLVAGETRCNILKAIRLELPKNEPELPVMDKGSAREKKGSRLGYTAQVTGFCRRHGNTLHGIHVS